MRGFQKDIMFGGRTSSVHNLVCITGLQICKIFASEFWSKLGVMRGFHKGITLGGRTCRSVDDLDFQNRVAK